MNPDVGASDPLREAHSAQAQAVYGLQIQDSHLATLTQRVLTLALVAIVFMVVQTGLSLFGAVKSGSTVGLAFIQLAVALLIPWCGWQGAKTNDVTLLSCFCGWNLASAICKVIAMFLVISSYHALTEEGESPNYGILVLGIITFSLNCASWYWGNELRGKVQEGVVINGAPRAVTQTTTVQPAVSV